MSTVHNQPAEIAGFFVLIDTWYMSGKPPKSAGPINLADGLLISGEYDKALDAYVAIPEKTAEILTRQGFALHLIGKPLESLPLMDADLCLASPSGKAALAVILDEARYARRAFTEPTDELRTMAVEAALDAVVSPYAIRRFWTLERGAATPEQRLEVASRGHAASGELYLIAWEARSLSSLGRGSEIDIPRLIEFAARNEPCAVALLDVCMDEGLWESADAAVVQLRNYAHTRSEPPGAGDLIQSVVDVLAARRMGDLKRAQRALSFTDSHPSKEVLPLPQLHMTSERAPVQTG